MKGTALFLIPIMVAALVVVLPAPALAQGRAFGGFYGGAHYGGYWGGRGYGGFYGGPFWGWGPWWPFYAAPIYYGAYAPYPYYAYPEAPQYAVTTPAPATQCYAPRLDQSGKVMMMPDYSKPVPCPTTR